MPTWKSILCRGRWQSHPWIAVGLSILLVVSLWFPVVELLYFVRSVGGIGGLWAFSLACVLSLAVVTWGVPVRRKGQRHES